MNKPTPLDYVLDYAARESVVDSSFSPQTLDAAREELRVLRELCEAVVSEDTEKWWTVLGKKSDAYREWNAKQEGGR